MERFSDFAKGGGALRCWGLLSIWRLRPPNLKIFPKVSELIEELRKYFAMGPFLQQSCILEVIGKNYQTARTTPHHSGKMPGTFS